VTETLPEETIEIERTLEAPRFGTVTYRDSEVLTFPWGMPGFNHLRRFLALNLESSSFVWLQSIEEPGIALPTADPWTIFADYAPRLPSYAVTSLELGGPDSFVTLCVVVVTAGAETMTMNLLAPIVVNLETRTARQVTLEGSQYSVREAIPRTAAPTPAPAA
jgi:flagellar assembly factor FliW